MRGQINSLSRVRWCRGAWCAEAPKFLQHQQLCVDQTSEEEIFFGMTNSSPCHFCSSHFNLILHSTNVAFGERKRVMGLFSRSWDWPLKLSFHGPGTVLVGPIWPGLTDSGECFHCHWTLTGWVGFYSFVILVQWELWCNKTKQISQESSSFLVFVFFFKQKVPQCLWVGFLWQR